MWLPAEAKTISALSDSTSLNVSASGFAGRPLMKMTFSWRRSSWVRTLATGRVGFWLARTMNWLFRYIRRFPVNGMRQTAQVGNWFSLKNVVQQPSQNSWPQTKLKKLRAVPSPSAQQTQHCTCTTTSPAGTGGRRCSSSSSSSSSLRTMSPSSALTSAKMSSTPWLSISSRSLCKSRSFLIFLYFLIFMSSKNRTEWSSSSSAVHVPFRYFVSLSEICLNKKEHNREMFLINCFINHGNITIVTQLLN